MTDATKKNRKRKADASSAHPTEPLLAREDNGVPRGDWSTETPAETAEREREENAVDPDDIDNKKAPRNVGRLADDT
jgi:hypothetical protein